MRAGELKRLVHELRVHQIELENQNEDLRQAQLALAQAHDRFRDLYNFAPVAFLTLDSRGIVREVNLTTAKMLGLARHLILQQKLSRFVAAGSQDVLHRHRNELLKKASAACEVKLRHANGHDFPARLVSQEFSEGTQDRFFHTALIDMTEIRQAEGALSDSEERFRSYLTASAEVVFRVRPDWREMHQLQGRDFVADEGTRSRSWIQKYIPASDRPMVTTAINEAIVQKKIFEMEHRIQRPDGSLGWALSRAVPRFGPQHEILEWIGAMSEITERKEAEASLQSSEERFALAVSVTGLGLFDWNVTTNKSLWSEQFVRLLGLTPSGPITTDTRSLRLCLGYDYSDWARRVHPQDLPRVEAELQRCLANRQAYAQEYRVLWPDGTLRWLASRGRFIYDEARKQQRMLGIAIDITGRKNTEEALHQLNTTLEQKVTQRTAELTRANQLLWSSEQALADFFKEAPIGLFWLSPKGKILKSNQTQATMLGYALSELLGRNLAELCSDPVVVSGMVRDLLRKETVRDRLVRLRRKNGADLHVLIDANGAWQNGKLSHSRWFLRDLSQRVELQKEILAIGERIRRQIGHELHDNLCQQLTGIEFLSRALERRLSADSDPRATEAKEIAQHTRRAMKHARELSHTTMSMELGALGLPQALKDLSAQTKTLYQVQCQFRGESTLALSDSTAATYLYRIAQEAISNAIKHGKASKICIELRMTQAHVVLRVQDDGSGPPLKAGKRRGFGLRIMDYRASELGGSVTLQKRSQGGALLVCSIPNLVNKPHLAKKQ